MYAVTQEAVVAELAYRSTRAADELHHTRSTRRFARNRDQDRHLLRRRVR